MGGKYDYIQQWQLPPRMEYTESNPLNGAAVAQGSMPPNRLIIDALSALTANLGRVTAGNIVIGDSSGARVHIGDEVDGMIFTDTQGRRILAFTRSDGKLSIGVKSGTGGPMLYTDLNALLRVHGDAIIDGTLQVGALVLPGPITSTFLDSDEIRIGTGTPGVDYDGFIVSDGMIGFYNNNVAVWEVEGTYGYIITKDATYPGLVYTMIGDGNITISNYQTATRRYALGFRAYHDEVYGTGTDIVLDTSVNVYANDGYLIFKNTIDNNLSASLQLWDSNGMVRGVFTGLGVFVITDEGKTASFGATSDGVTVSSHGTIQLKPVESTANMAELDASGHLTINGGALVFKEKSADPDDPAEGYAALWMSDGTGAGDDGDIMMKITGGGTTKTATLVDFSGVA